VAAVVFPGVTVCAVALFSHGPSISKLVTHQYNVTQTILVTDYSRAAITEGTLFHCLLLFLSLFIYCGHLINRLEHRETTFRAPKQRVKDFEQFHEYRSRKRKEFEARVYR
jgi:hypothetical protein